MILTTKGSFGVLYNEDIVNSLLTPHAIDDEIQRIVLGDYDPVIRDDQNNNVVTADSYIEFLNQRKDELTQTTRDVPNDTHSEMTQDDTSFTLQAENLHQKEIIQKLLALLKQKDNTVHQSETTPQSVDLPIYYQGDVPNEGVSKVVGIKGSLRALVLSISGDEHVSQYTNIATARGILGDERAKQVIDDLYSPGTFDEFLRKLEVPM